MQKKTGRPVQFEITEQTRDAIAALIEDTRLRPNQSLFPSHMTWSPHLSTRQYARIVKSWVLSIGLDPNEYGTHSMRRTKETLIYRRTKNLRAVQLLLGHSKLESTVRYFGIEVDDALEMAEKIRHDLGTHFGVDRYHMGNPGRIQIEACWLPHSYCQDSRKDDQR